MSATYYDVILRYRTEDRATGPMNQMGSAALRTDRIFGGLHRSTSSFTSTLGRVSSILSPISNGLIGVSTVGAAVFLTFRNLNQEMEGTLTIAAQLNAAFRYAPDPINSFGHALANSRQIVRE